MDDLIQCAIDRDDLRRWLELGHAPFTICRGEEAVTTLIRLQKAPSVDYLYQIAIGSDNSISWNSGLTFCGVYDMKRRTLYLAQGALKSFMEGQYPFISEPGLSVIKELCGRVNRQVEAVIANDRKNLPARKALRWRASRELGEYLSCGAKQEALHRFINSGEPDGLIHSGFTMDELPEAAFMAYLQDPEIFIQAESEQYIQSHQEDLLLQFLK